MLCNCQLASWYLWGELQQNMRGGSIGSTKQSFIIIIPPSDTSPSFFPLCLVVPLQQGHRRRLGHNWTPCGRRHLGMLPKTCHTQHVSHYLLGLLPYVERKLYIAASIMDPDQIQVGFLYWPSSCKPGNRVVFTREAANLKFQAPHLRLLKLSSHDSEKCER